MTMTKALIVGTLALGLGFGGAAAFVPCASHRRPLPTQVPTSQHDRKPHSPQTARVVTSLQMCICIHCARVTNCSAYHFVEQQHAQPHINKNPTWEPRNGSPTIEVHIRPDDDTTAENELDKMWDEHEDQTRRAEEASASGGATAGDDEPLFGEMQYDLSGSTSYEYDVVECEDFAEDKDAWVKNMPEEIRIANPDFVPT